MRIFGGGRLPGLRLPQGARPKPPAAAGVRYVIVLSDGAVAVYTADVRPIPELQGRWAEKEAAIRARWTEDTTFVDSRHRVELAGPDWRLLRRKVLHDEPKCRLCGLPATQVDHVVPLHWGGSPERSNLQGLCTECHRAKTTRESREEEVRWPTVDLRHLRSTDRLPAMLPGVKYLLDSALPGSEEGKA